MDFAKNIDLAKVKSDVNRLDIDKLKTVSVYLKKQVIQLIKIFLKKSKYNTDEQGLGKKKEMVKIKYQILVE